MKAILKEFNRFIEQVERKVKGLTQKANLTSEDEEAVQLLMRRIQALKNDQEDPTTCFSRSSFYRVYQLMRRRQGLNRSEKQKII